MRSVNVVAQIFFLAFYANAVAQQNIVERSENMLPPAPTAAELGKYGLLPVGLATGTARADISLFTYKTRNLSLPLSLSYSSNGIKIDQVASWVGIGWSLNAGGVVTRIIRDEPDQANPDPYPSEFGLVSGEAIKYLEKADPVNGFDSEQDLYAFNFMGYTGKFMYSREGELVIMPHQNIHVEHLIDDGSPAAGYFKITTPDGISFMFDAIESTKTINEGTGCGKSFAARRETSWFLSKVKHPSGDSINLEYEEYLYQYPLSITQTVGRNLSVQDVTCYQACFTDFVQTCQTNASVVGKRLKKISGTGFGTIEFAATADRPDIADDFKLNEIIVKDRNGSVVKRYHFGYTFSQSQDYSNDWTTAMLGRRMFLTSVEERDAANGLINSHLFTYEDMNALPPRLSYAQDHWGYFNGANNQYLVPIDESGIEDYAGRKVFQGIGGNRQPNSNFSYKGLLKTITWPTGGVTTLYYAANTYTGLKTIYPVSVPVFLGIKGSGLHTLRSISDTIQINFTQELKIELRANLDTMDYSDEINPLHHIVTVTVIDLNDQNVVYNQELAVGQVAVKYLDVDINHNYRIDLTATGRIVYGTLVTSYLPSGPTTVETTNETGGLRISKTVDSDLVTGNSNTTNYLYAQHTNKSVSSGVSRALPIYYASETQISQLSCGNSVGNSPYSRLCYNGIMHSSSVSTLYPSDGGNVFYRFVTVSKGENETNGVTEHEFIINFDQQAEQVWGNNEILSVPLSNFGWNNGLEKAVRVLRKTESGYVTVKTTTNEYKRDDRVQFEIRNLVVRRRYDPGPSGQAVITCDAAGVNAKWRTRVCLANHQHTWLINPSNVRCIKWGADNHWEESYGVCYGREVGEQVLLPYALDHIDAMQYRSLGYWFYLFRKTETTYDANGQNPVSTATEFQYDNPAHSLLTTTRQAMSDGKLKEVTTRYVSDYDVAGNFETLRDKFIVGLPIQTRTTVDGRLSQADIFAYNDMGLPVQLYKFEGTPLQNVTPFDPSVIIPSTDFILQATLTYDATGNLKDLNARKSPDISYLWGYNGSKIVAKAVGAVSSRIFVEGFEETGNDLNAKTGEKCLASGSYSISTTSFNPSSTENLVMSYWYWDSNQWKFSGEVAFNRNISAGSKLDEIRVYPRGAQLTTITYDSHFDDVKSITDPNNMSQYYHYDNAGRLKNIVDENGDVVTSYKYKYYNN